MIAIQYRPPPFWKQFRQWLFSITESWKSSEKIFTTSPVLWTRLYFCNDLKMLFKQNILSSSWYFWISTLFAALYWILLGWKSACLNPLNPKSDQLIISPYSNTAQSFMKIMKIKESWSPMLKALIVKRILLASAIGNVWRRVSRIWILILRCKGLSKASYFVL